MENLYQTILSWIALTEIEKAELMERQVLLNSPHWLRNQEKIKILNQIRLLIEKEMKEG